MNAVIGTEKQQLGKDKERKIPVTVDMEVRLLAGAPQTPPGGAPAPVPAPVARARRLSKRGGADAGTGAGKRARSQTKLKDPVVPLPHGQPPPPPLPPRAAPLFPAGMIRRAYTRQKRPSIEAKET